MKPVSDFEKLIAEYFNAPYAVATDCCTHAVELCLRIVNPASTGCPRYTYPSIPMTFTKLNIPYVWTDELWENYYYLNNTNIIDAAVYWKENGYIPGTLMCVSFQFQKHLNLIRGGVILLDNLEQYNKLSKMRYDGRDLSKPWRVQDIDTIGYHYYMPPETAELGIKKFPLIKDIPPKLWSYTEYPDISKMKVFQGK